jgi:hypothetical protein
MSRLAHNNAMLLAAARLVSDIVTLLPQHQLNISSPVNIYFQRNPSVEPAVACPNPTANTLVVCGLYSEPVNATEIVNKGQNRGPADANGQAFEVVIRGSNGQCSVVARLASY